MPEFFDIGKDIRIPLAKIRRAAENPSKLMKQIGAMGLASAQAAFEQQKLGDIEWLPRYPGQQPPVLNIAGVIQDFNAGRKAPKPTRFFDRPAVVDEGQRGGIWGSLTAVLKNPVTAAWGTNKNYAQIHQDGGETTIPITAKAKEGIRSWLFTAKGAGRKTPVTFGVSRRVERHPSTIPEPTPEKLAKHKAAVLKQWDKANKKTAKRSKIKGAIARLWKKLHGLMNPGLLDELARARYEKAERSFTVRERKQITFFDPSAPIFKGGTQKARRVDYADKLEPLLSMDQWTQEVAARPFLGITDQTADDMVAQVEQFFRDAQK